MSIAAPLQNSTVKPRKLSDLGNGGRLLQRKCACGSPTSSLTGECDECKSKESLGLQTKLRISEPGDIYELEADRVAYQVMRITDADVSTRTLPHLQRFGLEKSTAAQKPNITHEVLFGQGQPLDSETRAFMETRFRHDFSQVRVHTDAKASESARAINASAYTIGRHITFAAGEYQPDSLSGRQLLAHELAHTVQQSRSGIAAFPLSSTEPIVQRRVTRDLNTMSDTELSAEAQRVRVWLKTHGMPDLDYYPTVEYLQTIEAEQFARNKESKPPETPPPESAEPARPFGPPRPPTPVKPALGQLPWGRYVDAFDNAYYDINYKVEQGYSDVVRIVYDDGTMLELNVRKELLEKSTTSEAARHAMARGNVGRGGRIFPTDLTPRTVPRLWALREDVFEKQNKAFAGEATLLVEITIFVLSVPAMPAGAILAEDAPKLRASSRPATKPPPAAAEGVGAGGGKALPPEAGGTPLSGGGGPGKQPLKASGRVESGGPGNKPASVKALREKEAAVAPGSSLPVEQQKIAQSLIEEHPHLNPKVANDAAKGGASAAGKGGAGADVPLLNGGGREISVHQSSSPFTADSVGSHLQQEALQKGTTEIYLQINSGTREGFLKMLPQLRNAYLELRDVLVKIYGADGSVWWSGTFGGPK